MAGKAAKKENTEDGEKKKGGKLKLIIILVVLLALLGGGGFVAWKFFLQPKPEKEGNHTEETVQEEGGHGEEKKDGEVPAKQIVTLDSFVVNLSDPLGRRYLKLTMDVELVDAAAAAALNAALPKVKDTVLLLLSSKSYGEIGTLEQKLALKNEIVERLNQVVGKAKVENVYFTEFVIQ